MSFKALLRSSKKNLRKTEKLRILDTKKGKLNAIIGTKIHFRREGPGFIPKNKKKYDVTIVTFIPEKNGAKKKFIDNIKWLL